MGACASRSDDDGVDAASHLEASPAGPGGAATVKAELERPRPLGARSEGKARRPGTSTRVPGERRGARAASPVAEAAARVPRTPKLRSAASRAPIPAPPPAGAARGPAAAAGAASDTPRATPTPTRGTGSVDDPETERTFLD